MRLRLPRSVFAFAAATVLLTACGGSDGTLHITDAGDLCREIYRNLDEARIDLNERLLWDGGAETLPQARQKADAIARIVALQTDDDEFRFYLKAAAIMLPNLQRALDDAEAGRAARDEDQAVIEQLRLIARTCEERGHRR